MTLDVMHRQLAWPSPVEILNPQGIGARMYVQLANEKLGKTIELLPGGRGVQVGVLSAEPDTSEAPIAVICLFTRPVPLETLLQTHRLAWNFGRTLLLITIEPNQIRSWSCCETPVDGTAFSSGRMPYLPTDKIKSPEVLPPLVIEEQTGRLQGEAAESLHWLELLSGRFFENYAKRFPQERRVDQMLLNNLKAVRQSLRDENLDDFYSHDLLARIIFIQFLFHRKDSSGHSALNANKLAELSQNGILTKPYETFADLLDNYDDAYSLFRWLNTRFNGDLFPAQVTDKEEVQQAAWAEEMKFVKARHLELLSSFVRGDIVLKSRQRSFWPQYAFDAIPLEFVSSIYEEFVSKDTSVGIHYTPDYLVDLMLDRVLPLGQYDWNLKVLDPACGSGIFLVKAFQRLIHRWKLANEGKEIAPDTLRYILENNLFGVDKDPNAVRVASFSLYLAMCDEIDPRHYWSDPNRVQFPSLRNKRIIESDFFDDDCLGIRSEEDAVTYDIVIGNPPWGGKTLTQVAESWSQKYAWTVANKDFGVLFVAKSAQLTKREGLICLVQSAGALLYNQLGTALRLRRKIFLEFRKVENIINLGAFRSAAVQIFRDVKVPTCILILQNIEPDGEAFLYECPKPRRTSEDINRITIENGHYIYPEEAISEPWIWSALMWGGNRDRELLYRLSQYESLQKLKQRGVIKTRDGVVWGTEHKKLEEKIRGRRRLDVEEFASEPGIYLAADALPKIDDPHIYEDDSTDFSAFELPQLILKKSWIQETARFQSKMVSTTAETQGVICSKSFISVHAEHERLNLLETCCACYNSNFATYYLFLTSGRFAFDRSEVLSGEMLKLPLPHNIPTKILEDLTTPQSIDKRVYELFSLKEADTILIEDMLQYTLPDFKGKGNLPGNRSTRRVGSDKLAQNKEPDLSSYCHIFQRVMRAAYGTDKFVGAVIYSEEGPTQLPMRLVRVYLNSPTENSIEVEALVEPQLRKFLAHPFGNSRDRQSLNQRCVMTYDQLEGRTGLIVNIVKPDQIRYWTRSMALRDADQVATDLKIWSMASSHLQSQMEMFSG